MFYILYYTVFYISHILYYTCNSVRCLYLKFYEKFKIQIKISQVERRCDRKIYETVTYLNIRKLKLRTPRRRKIEEQDRQKRRENYGEQDQRTTRELRS